MLVKILMIENDMDDRALTEESFMQAWPDVSIEFLFGVDVPGWLERAEYKPQLILLTMNAQPYIAPDLIRLVRSTTGFGSIPVIVLSESNLPQEVQGCYVAGANAFIKKPDNYGDTLFKIRTFINYWLHTAELPTF
jgi:CheY-like chemotaxis protein